MLLTRNVFITLITFWVVSVNFSISQNATLIVDAFYNRDNKIKNNIKLDSATICICNANNDTIFHNKVELRFKYRLPPGLYKINAYSEGYNEILIKSIPLYEDHLEFISLLFEPKSIKRKRFYTSFRR